MKKYYLYVDESGDFDTDLDNERKNPSLVGGLLWANDELPDTSSFEKTMEGIIADHNHATDLAPDEKGLLVYELLKAAKEYPVQFVIFENDVRKKILTSTQTYLTMITEGVIQLLKKLVILEDEPVDLTVVAGFKKDTTIPVTSSFTEGYIRQEDYRKRLEEKMAVEKAKAGFEDITRSRVTLRLADDKRNTVLVVCDYVCNFRYTNPARAFSVTVEEDGRSLTVRDALKPLYRQEYIFSLFHTREDDHVLRMVEDGFYADALFESMSGMMTPANQNLVWESFLKNRREEIHRQLASLSGYIGVLVSSRENDELAGKVLKQAEALHNFLMEQHKEDLWFYLDVQLYDLALLDYREDYGAMEELFAELEPMIAEFTAKTLDMDFLLIYYTRKAVFLQNQFRYEESILVCDQMELLVSMMEEALQHNDLLQLSGNARCDRLGKILGTRLQAQIVQCMLGKLPYEEALETSERAMEQFTFASDLKRQYQYRAQLEAVAGHFESALSYMEKSFEDTPWRTYLSGPDKGNFDLYNMAYVAAFTLLQKTEGKEGDRENVLEIARFLYQNCRKEIPSGNTVGALTRLYLASALLSDHREEDKGRSLLRRILSEETGESASDIRIRRVCEDLLRQKGSVKDYFRFQTPQA